MSDSRLIRISICTAFLALSMIQCLRPAHAAGDVLGLWSSISKSRGGIGTQLNISPDGSLTQILGAIVDFQYEIREGKVAMTFSSGDKAMTQTFQLHDNVLILEPGTPSEQVMQRTKESPAAAGVVGEWNYQHYTGGPALLRYSSRHVGQLVVPMATLRGRYDLNGSRINVTLEGKTSVPYDFRVDVDTLTLRDESGKETAFKRFHY